MTLPGIRGISLENSESLHKADLRLSQAISSYFHQGQAQSEYFYTRPGALLRALLKKKKSPFQVIQNSFHV